MRKQYAICLILLVYFQQYMYVESGKTTNENKMPTSQHRQQEKNGDENRLVQNIQIQRTENNKVVGVKNGKMMNNKVSTGKQSNIFNMSIQKRREIYNECCKICCDSKMQITNLTKHKMDSTRVKRGFHCNQCMHWNVFDPPCRRCGNQDPLGAYIQPSSSYGHQPSYYPESSSYGHQPSYYPESSSYGHQPSYYPESSSYGHQPSYYPESSSYGHQPSYYPESSSYSPYQLSGGSSPTNRVIKVNGNEYEIVNVLGQSRNEPVYHVKCNGNSYALKEGVTKNEIKAIKACKGTGVIRCIDSDENGNLVMEMGIKTLADAIEEKNLNGLTPATIKRQLKKGLKTIHNAGYVHHDLDENNIMFFPGPTVKIIDFGEAIKSTDSEDRNHDKELLKNLIARI